MKLCHISFTLLALISFVSCGNGSSEYDEGRRSGREKVNETHQKYGWGGELLMDAGDELNYVPNERERSPDYNAGKVDGYLSRRREVDSAQRETRSERIDALMEVRRQQRERIVQERLRD